MGGISSRGAQWLSRLHPGRADDEPGLLATDGGTNQWSAREVFTNKLRSRARAAAENTDL